MSNKDDEYEREMYFADLRMESQRDQYMVEKTNGYIKDLEEKLEIAIKALEYYANPKNYNMDSSYIEDDDELISYNDILDIYEFGNNKKYPCQDYVGGKRARAALKEIDKCGQ